MNPLQSNLQSLKEDISQFKKEFSHLKSASSLCPSKLALQCLICPQSMYIEVSDNPYETFERFKTHIDSIGHSQYIRKIKSYKICCKICNTNLTLQTNSSCKNSLIMHLKSSKHKTLHKTMVGGVLDIMKNKFMALHSNVNELDVKLDCIIGKFDMILKTAENGINPPVAKPMPAPAPVKEIKYPKNTTIVCNACKCSVSCSLYEDLLLENIHIHLQGNRHSDNITEATVKSLWCFICDFTVLIAEDFESSYQIMKIHINGCRHSGVEEDSSSIICNVCESSMSNKRYDWDEGSDAQLLENFQYHLYDGQHGENITVARNKSIWCSKCKCKVIISEDLNASYNNVETHICGYKHTRVDETEEEEEEEDDDDDDDDYDDDVIVCNVCECEVATSNDYGWNNSYELLNTIRNHLHDWHHDANVETSRNLSFWCSKCECRVPISEDSNTSYWNVEKHVNGFRHTNEN